MKAKNNVSGKGNSKRNEHLIKEDGAAMLVKCLTKPRLA